MHENSFAKNFKLCWEQHEEASGRHSPPPRTCPEAPALRPEGASWRPISLCRTRTGKGRRLRACCAHSSAPIPGWLQEPWAVLANLVMTSDVRLRSFKWGSFSEYLNLLEANLLQIISNLVSSRSKFILPFSTKTQRQVLLQTAGKRDWAGKEKTGLLLGLQKAAKKALYWKRPHSDGTYSTEKCHFWWKPNTEERHSKRVSPSPDMVPPGTTSAASSLAFSLQDLLTLASFTLLDLLDFEQ